MEGHDTTSPGTSQMIAGGQQRDTLIAAGDRLMLLDQQGRQRSGAELVARVDRIAGALLRESLAGRRVGLWYRNCLAAVEAFLAVEWIGGTRVPVDPGAAAAEARDTFDAAGADFVLADAEHAAMLPSAVVHDDNSPLVGSPQWPALPVDPDHTLMLYPRMVRDGTLLAVPISYRNWAETIRINQAMYRSGRYGTPIRPDDRFLTVQQLMHGTGMLGTFPFLMLGLPQLIMSRYDPDTVLDAVERFQITSTMLVSGMVGQLTSAAEGRAATAGLLRRVIYGGAPLSAQVLRSALNIFGPVLVQVYGRLEGGWPISVLDVDAHAEILAGEDDLLTSCGQPIDEVETRIRTTTQSADNVGELCVRTTMAVPECTDPDGWCSLGDLVRRDERGFLHHLGRLDGMINNGYHVYPAEIEQALLRLPEVAAARVVGEPDPRRGERVAAYVVPHASEPAATLVETIRTRLREQLAAYKVPERVEIVTALP